MTIMRIRDVRLLVVAVGLSALGDLALMIPLVLRIQERTGSTIAVSLFFVALFGPLVLLAGPAGLAVDRLENARLLALASLAQAVVAVVLGFTDSVAAIIGLTALLGAGAAVSQTAEFALVPAAAGEARAGAAFGHVEAARYIGMTVGPVLGGALAAAGLLRLAVLLDAASFAAVALVAGTIRARRDPRAEAGRPRAAGDSGRARDGLAFLARDRVLAVTLSASVGALLFFSVSFTAELFFAVDVLGAGQAGYGLLLGAWTAGMVAGAVGAAPRVPVRWHAGGALAAVAAQGAGLAAAAAASTLVAALAGFAVGGAAHGLKNVVVRTLIHERAPDALRGRAFAAYNGARNAAELGAIAAGGALVAAIGARAALALSGLVPLAIGLLALALVRGRRPAAIDPTTPIRRSLHAHVQG